MVVQLHSEVEFIQSRGLNVNLQFNFTLDASVNFPVELFVFIEPSASTRDCTRPKDAQPARKKKKDKGRLDVLRGFLGGFSLHGAPPGDPRYPCAVRTPRGGGSARHPQQLIRLSSSPGQVGGAAPQNFVGYRLRLGGACERGSARARAEFSLGN